VRLAIGKAVLVLRASEGCPSPWGEDLSRSGVGTS